MESVTTTEFSFWSEFRIQDRVESLDTPDIMASLLLVPLHRIGFTAGTFGVGWGMVCEDYGLSLLLHVSIASSLFGWHMTLVIVRSNFTTSEV